jgi:hypothetical protein
MNQASLRLRDKPFWSLGPAVTDEYMLDKEQTSYNDLLDGFRFSLILYKQSKDWRMDNKDFVAISINDSSTSYPPQAQNYSVNFVTAF